MKRKLVLFFSVMLALVILIIQGYREESISINPLYKTSTMRGVHIIRKESGKVSWELTADDAVFSADEERVRIASLAVEVAGEPHIFIRGSSGVFDVARETFFFDKHVEMMANDGIFTTGQLTWNSRTGVVTTDDYVTFRGRNYLMEGRGLLAQTKEKTINILGYVKGTFYL